jgi:hypothetical protein
MTRSVIPALSMAEEERHRGVLDEARENFLIQSINEFIADTRGPMNPGPGGAKPGDSRGVHPGQ